MAEGAHGRGMTVALAKAVVTTTLAGPVAGVGVAAEMAIIAIAARFPKGCSSAYEQAASRVSAGVHAWAGGERLAEDDLRAASGRTA